MAVINAGDVIAGKYRVERVLGEGGMGFVVAATHVALESTVAIKFIRAGALATREASVRFLREAKAVVQLKNQHVAQVLDVGTLETGEPFMVMEYLEGCDLSELLKRRGSIPVTEASDYIVQACDALGEAHALGFVHRDVKLGNLFLTRGPSGVPMIKVLDFGLSKANVFGDKVTQVTVSAALLGSPRFMSPEQLQDPRTVDARTDVWSLGVVLYALVSGRPAFDGDTVGKLFAKVMTENPPHLGQLVPHLPPGFAEVVAGCLVKSREGRFSSVADLAAALSPYTSNPGRAQATANRTAAVLASSAVPQVAALAPGSQRSPNSQFPPSSQRPPNSQFPPGSQRSPANVPIAIRSGSGGSLGAMSAVPGPWEAQGAPSSNNGGKGGKLWLTGAPVAVALVAIGLVSGAMFMSRYRAASAIETPPPEARGDSPAANALPGPPDAPAQPFPPSGPQVIASGSTAAPRPAQARAPAPTTASQAGEPRPAAPTSPRSSAKPPGSPRPTNDMPTTPD